MINYISTFVSDTDHVEWITSVGEKFLKRKNLPVSKYIDNLQRPDVPLDQLGLLIYARMYHQHFAIILKGTIWSTKSDNSIEGCDLVFAYCGGIEFSDTCTGPAYGPLPSTPSYLKTVISETKPLAKPKPKSKINNKRSRSTSRSKPAGGKKRSNLRSQTPVSAAVHYGCKVVKRTTRNSSKRGACSIDLDLILSKRKRRHAAPMQLQEQDPHKGHVSNLSD